jgi:hypothetical protein
VLLSWAATSDQICVHSVERSPPGDITTSDPLYSLPSSAWIQSQGPNASQNQNQSQSQSQSKIKLEKGDGDGDGDGDGGHKQPSWLLNAGAQHKRAFNKLLGLSSLSRPEASVLWDVRSSIVFDYNNDDAVSLHPASKVRLTGVDLVSCSLHAPRDTDGEIECRDSKNRVIEGPLTASNASYAMVYSNSNSSNSNSRVASRLPSFLLVQQSSQGDVFVQQLLGGGKGGREGTTCGDNDNDPLAARRIGSCCLIVVLLTSSHLALSAAFPSVLSFNLPL